ncbi:hypothetical protein [Blastopirellula marina]|uniref:PH domain-containing protein n=1 Tax=Blastopirellula marina TaxID=124 RepID=A0A2S8FU36_9BACT|nr:hypothetical protein [Blastopirellula marina]PQO35570.1 hypothetical protein C5Y98_13060 [Blastopirellula marina]PTL44209.1 hypothetical protein C5Y97_13070 [Blastopirellula marina]
METPPKLEFDDPRSGQERLLVQAGMFIVPFTTLFLVIAMAALGTLWQNAFSIGFFVCFTSSFLLLFNYVARQWMIVGVDAAELTIQRDGEQVRIPWPEVVRLDWTYWGNVTLWTADGRRVMPPQIKDRRQRMSLYRELRRHVPPENQRNWPLFCQQRIAGRLANSHQDSQRPPNQEEFLLTRSSFDRNWLWVVPLMIVDCIVVVEVTGHWDMAVGVVLATVALLLFSRYRIPPAGEIRPRRSLVNWWLPASMTLLNLIGGLFLASIVAMRSSDPAIVAGGETAIKATAGGIVVIGLVVVAAIALFGSRRFTPEQAVELWDQLDEELLQAQETASTNES